MSNPTRPTDRNNKSPLDRGIFLKDWESWLSNENHWGSKGSPKVVPGNTMDQGDLGMGFTSSKPDVLS